MGACYKLPVESGVAVVTKVNGEAFHVDGLEVCCNSAMFFDELEHSFEILYVLSTWWQCRRGAERE